MKKFLITASILLISISFISCSKDDPAPTPPPADVNFSATINGASEVPANASSAAGTATASFNPTTKILTVNVTYAGVTATAAHVHKGAVGVSGGVIFPFASLTSPMSLTTVALDATQEADLMGNLYYVNIHSAAYPGGEIRGQLIKQ